VSLTIKGRFWRDGNFWKAEIPEFDILVKASDPGETIKKLSEAIDKHADGMEYEITTNGTLDGPLIFDTDQWKKAVLLILKRRIL
jgi:hypothetical protein